MESVTELFKIGPGPSSSHTFGPMRACQYILDNYPEATQFHVVLYGSLAFTGKGHLTDKIIKKTLKKCTIDFDYKTQFDHPNTMTIEAFDDVHSLGKHIFESIGGGLITIDGKTNYVVGSPYTHHSMDEIQKYCGEHHIRLDEYVDVFEEKINPYMDKIFKAMIQSVERGLKATGKLPGALKIDRIAHALYQSASSVDSEEDRNFLLLSSYAYAASEQNASGNMVVTAPTMGSAGVLPALVYQSYKDLGYQKRHIVQALKVAGLIGCLIQENATISGAEGGCQAEVGAACSMGAAFVASLEMQTNEQIECAAEIGLEHHLGLTCDPVGGYVMIPCIERNAVAAKRSLDAAKLAKYLRNVKKNRVSFDMVVKTMNLTGKKLPIELKESALGGLAAVVKS